MKILSLNAWGGRMKEKLFDYIKAHAGDVDIFAFQEIFKGGTTSAEIKGNLTNMKDSNSKLFEDLQEFLTEYNGIFCPVFDKVYGIAIFSKKNIEVLERGELILFENKDFPNSPDDIDHTRKAQWIVVNNGGKKLFLMNVHGTWTAKGKNDTPERITQSERIISLTNKYKMPKIIIGDFNLRPDTKSIQMLDENFIDLIKENNIPATRTTLYTKTSEKHADYVFISDDIKVNAFKVDTNHEASDHASLELDIDL